MPNYLNSVTVVADDIEAARAQWARLGFALLPGGVIALGSARIVLRDACEIRTDFRRLQHCRGARAGCAGRRVRVASQRRPRARGRRRSA